MNFQLFFPYKFSHKTFLVLKKQIFKCFALYGHGGHLVQWRGSIRTNWQYPLDRRTHMKSGENSSSGFREDIKKLHYFIHVYRPGVRADDPKGTKF